MAGMAATGSEARPMPARGRAWAIYDVFQTKDDEELFIGVTSDQQWERFVEEFDLTDLRNDPRLSTNPKRVEEREWLLPAVRKSLQRHDRNLSPLKISARNACESATSNFSTGVMRLGIFISIKIRWAI